MHKKKLAKQSALYKQALFSFPSLSFFATAVLFLLVFEFSIVIVNRVKELGPFIQLCSLRNPFFYQKLFADLFVLFPTYLLIPQKHKCTHFAYKAGASAKRQLHPWWRECNWMQIALASNATVWRATPESGSGLDTLRYET